MNNTKEKTINPKQVAEVEPLMIRAERAADICGVSLRQWHSMRAAGLCPPSLKVGGCRLWRLDVIRQWVAMDCPPIDKFEKLLKARGIEL